VRGGCRPDRGSDAAQFKSTRFKSAVSTRRWNRSVGPRRPRRRARRRRR